jgi:hypothetical protein
MAQLRQLAPQCAIIEYFSIENNDQVAPLKRLTAVRLPVYDGEPPMP